MALQNPSSLYSGGNVRFDNTPYLRIALNERYKREARAQAIDQYYQKLPETVNDKGVRDLEVPIIGDVKNRMMEYWMTNRDALKSGDANAQLGMQKLYRQAQSVIRESQNAAKIDMNLGRIALDKNNQDLLNTDEFLQRHSSHNRPVTDPEYKPLDVTEVMAYRPFNQGNFLKEIKNQFKYSDGIPTITPHPQDKNLEVVTTNPVLDDTAKEGIYAYSSNKLHNDKAFERQLIKDFSTPEQLAPLNEISKKVFGHEIKEAEDIAAAYTASLLPNTAVRQRVTPSIDARNDEWDRRNDITFKQKQQLKFLDDKLIKGRKNANGEDEIVIGFPTDELYNAYGEDVNTREYGVKKLVYKDRIPEGIMRTINPTDMNKMIFPVDGVQIKQPDGTYKEAYYYNSDGSFEGKGGKKIGRDDARDNYIKERAPTKVKQAVGSKGKITTPTQTPTKKGKLD